MPGYKPRKGVEAAAKPGRRPSLAIGMPSNIVVQFAFSHNNVQSSYPPLLLGRKSC